MSLNILERTVVTTWVSSSLFNDLVLRSMHESSEEEIPMSDAASKVLSTLRSLCKHQVCWLEPATTWRPRCKRLQFSAAALEGAVLLFILVKASLKIRIVHADRDPSLSRMKPDPSGAMGTARISAIHPSVR